MKLDKWSCMCCVFVSFVCCCVLGSFTSRQCPQPSEQLLLLLLVQLRAGASQNDLGDNCCGATPPSSPSFLPDLLIRTHSQSVNPSLGGSYPSRPQSHEAPLDAQQKTGINTHVDIEHYHDHSDSNTLTRCVKDSICHELLIRFYSDSIPIL